MRKVLKINFLFFVVFIAGMYNAFGDKALNDKLSWREKAVSNGLNQDDLAILGQQKILITNQAYKQFFSVYLAGDTPFFITSDSLLNAYHVLYEESIFHLENKMAERLPEILKFIYNNLDSASEGITGNPKLLEKAKNHAALVIGTGIGLLDDSFQINDPELNKIMRQEIARIVAAEEVGKPQWLGAPTYDFTAIDYSRYKPRGFYTRSEKLKRYFRAVAWLQSIPFRVSNDSELLAILMLGNCITDNRFGGDSAQLEQYQAFFRIYKMFVGCGDDWDLITASHNDQNTLKINLSSDDLDGKKSDLIKMAKRYGRNPEINDQIRFFPESNKQVVEPNFRIISAYRTPDAILFQRTTDGRLFNRKFPDVLEVPAALGSDFARINLKDPQKAKLLKAIDQCKKYFKGDSLYLRYLEALAALLDKPEPDAPGFMKTEAWQAKSCNTVLAGWAQLRHTWALQAKQTAWCGCGALTPSGFVEPELEFYSRMCSLVDNTKALLKKLNVFEPNYAEVYKSINLTKRVLKGINNQKDFNKKLKALSKDERNDMHIGFSLLITFSPKAERGSKAYCQECVKWLSIIENDIRNNKMQKHPLLKEMLADCMLKLDEKWASLNQICRRLKSLSHKQLRGISFNESENIFIKKYGISIAKIMFYGGNSYFCPKDNAPKVIDVYNNMFHKEKYLHVGIGRPRKIYVLYPWQKKTDLMCRGYPAVLFFCF